MADICLMFIGLLPFLFLAVLVGIFVLPIVWALLPIVIVREWEGGIVLRLGKFQKSLGKGLNFVIPFIDRVILVDKRVETIDIPKQEVMTADNIPIKIDGVIYFTVNDSSKAILNVEEYFSAIALFGQTAIRDVVGGVNLDKILEDRDGIAENIKSIVDEDMLKWGIEIVAINIQHVEMPEEMKRAMARQAEAEREKRAVIITSQGELEASKNLQKAAEILVSDFSAINLRTLSFLSEISSDTNTEFDFIIPLDNMDILKMTDIKKKR
ncbi:slipin family protein [Candidatus Micrarchaeota archaeon]|nr:slipin family protein [Candidatus Micrarchaeota archaeon]